MRPVDSDVVSSIQRHAAMTWAQRLKRVFNIDIEVCGRCGGSVRVIGCIEDQDVIDRTVAQKARQILARQLNLLTQMVIGQMGIHLRHFGA